MKFPEIKCYGGLAKENQTKAKQSNANQANQVKTEDQTQKKENS